MLPLKQEMKLITVDLEMMHDWSSSDPGLYIIQTGTGKSASVQAPKLPEMLFVLNGEPVIRPDIQSAWLDIEQALGTRWLDFKHLLCFRHPWEPGKVYVNSQRKGKPVFSLLCCWLWLPNPQLISASFFSDTAILLPPALLPT